MRFYLVFCLAFCFLIKVSGQQLPIENKVLIESVKYSETITAEDLKSYLTVLASDDFQGRETGTPGNEMAANFLAEKLKSFGVAPIPGTDTYFQNVAFTRMKWNNLSFEMNGREIQHKRDYVMVPSFNPNEDINLSTDEVVFLGYGIDDKMYSDYKGQQVAGKVILIYAGEPKDKEGNYRTTGTKEVSAWTDSYQKKLEAAQKAGVKAVIIIEDQIREKAGRYRGELIGGTTLMGGPEDFGSDWPANMWLSPTIAKELLGPKMKKVIKARKKITKKGKSKSVPVETQIQLQSSKIVTSMPGVNVLAYIEGSDSLMKDEVVVISAHYDHVGMRGQDIFNGADDNGSGTSGVLEIAQAFQAAKDKGVGPKRSILCLFVTGEEKGLLGSDYYSQHPVFPLEKTVADINIDMIGRIDDKHDHENYIYVIGSDRLSSELHRINEVSNEKFTQLELDYTYNAEDDPNRFYYRSDHYNFAKNGIPSIFFFSGTHADYHRPTDTIDKILFGKAAKITKLAFFNAWELANRRERIKVDVKPKT
jgi:hypothetical protein